MGARLRLLRWLGPWAHEGRSPAGVVRVEERVGPDLRAYRYTPAGAPPLGAYLLIPGLHFLGPDDPRLDRFARILAYGGFVVLAPFLPSFLDLRVEARVTDDAARALAHLQRTHPRPALFSISFGSLPALRLAAAPAFAEAIAAVIVFGGYAEFDAVLRFCLGEAPNRDPLNAPVVLMNLIEHLRGAPEDRAPLMAAWHAYLRATWGRPEMKARERYEPVAKQIAATLSTPDERRLFLIGTGLEPGALELCVEALEKRRDISEALDPRPHLHTLRAPVHLMHGADDDVIPAAQLQLLEAAMPPHVETRTYLTGLYAHTGQAGPALASLLREARTMIRMLDAIATAPTAAGRR